MVAGLRGGHSPRLPGRGCAASMWHCCGCRLALHNCGVMVLWRVVAVAVLAIGGQARRRPRLGGGIMGGLGLTADDLQALVGVAHQAPVFRTLRSKLIA